MPAVAKKAKICSFNSKSYSGSQELMTRSSLISYLGKHIHFLFPEIEVEPQNTQTSIGGDVLLECYSPDADLVVWKKEGQKIDFGREFRIKVSLRFWALFSAN